PYRASQDKKTGYRHNFTIMNKQELLQLEKLATLTPGAIQKQNRTLFAKLSEAASRKLKDSVEEKLKDAPAELKAGLKKVEFSAAKLGTIDVKSALSEAVLAGRVSATRKKELEATVASMPNLGNIDTVLQADVPVFLNPLFKQDLQKAKLYRLNAITGIADAKTEKLFGSEVRLENLESEQIETLVGEKTITREEGDKLELAASLYHLVDGSFELAAEIEKQAKPTALSDLVKVDKTEWKMWLEASKADLGEGVTSDDYAEFLAGKVAQLYPEASLIHRTARVVPTQLQKNINAIEPLAKKNAVLFGAQAFDELDTTGLTASQVDTLRIQYEEIDALVKANPGLQLGAVLNDEAIKPADKGKVITGRIGLI